MAEGAYTAKKRQAAQYVRYHEAEKKRDQVMDLLLQGSSVEEAVTSVGLSLAAYRQWKARDPLFAAEVESVITGARKFKTEDPGDWTSFMDFRRKFFGHSTPPHMARIIQAMEETQPGDVTMILVPPGHAKTTLFEDYACFKLALNPEYRITVGSEGQRLAEKVLGRIKARMEPDGPFPTFVNQFGPFVPQKHGGRATRQVWAAAFFNVAKRNTSDERDYNMVALGFGGNIAGTRTDHLHVDDMQSNKSLAQTDKMVETFQQDWLSRPGETGITTINGTRVGDGDFYEALEDRWGGKEWFRVVRLPAIVRNPKTGEKEPLWKYDPTSKMQKKGYTLAMLDKERDKVGEDAWARNYMQQPRAKSLGTFTEDIVDRCRNYERTLGVDMPAPGAPVYIGLDPALGGINCLMAVQITSNKLYLLDVQEDKALSRNEQIMDRLEAMIVGVQARGGIVSDVVIEAMNFQRGLARDERLREMGDQYGFAIREHMTGSNKIDPDIGVPSMARAFIKREVDIAYGDDDRTREIADQFRYQLLRWAPGKRGTQLRQDQVMAFWFCWNVWQTRRRTIATASTSFKGDSLPWKPMDSGLLIPTNASPFYKAG